MINEHQVTQTTPKHLLCVVCRTEFRLSLVINPYCANCLARMLRGDV